jgi:hypothetical protein
VDDAVSKQPVSATIITLKIKPDKYYSILF